MIDIGGVTLLRAAAKNWARVGVVVDPADYPVVIEKMQGARTLDQDLRLYLARKAFAHTAAYDASIVGWLDELADGRAGTEARRSETSLSPATSVPYHRPCICPSSSPNHCDMARTPISRGARYRNAGQTSWWDEVVQHGGMELSYLNLYDADAAWALVHEIADLGPAAAVVVKHANPCGAAVAATLLDAYEGAFECDPMSAFGGIVALSAPVDERLAGTMVANAKADVVIAPAYSDEALALFAARRKNMRVLAAPRAEGRPVARAPGERRLARADPVPPGPRARKMAGGDFRPAQRGKLARPPVGVEGVRRRQVERHRAGRPRESGGHRRGPAKPCLPGRTGRGAGRREGRGRGRGERRLLSLPGRLRHGRRRRRELCRATGRFGSGCRGHCRRRGARHRYGVHGRAPVPALRQ